MWRECWPSPVLCVAFHPLGDHIIATTSHPVIRLYDVTTSQCFVCPIPSHHHKRKVNSINGSADGCVKLWDTVSNRCFNTFVNAHDGSEVCSVAFTRNSKTRPRRRSARGIPAAPVAVSSCLWAITALSGTVCLVHRKARARSPGDIQPHRGLRDVPRRGHDVALHVAFPQRQSLSAHVPYVWSTGRQEHVAQAIFNHTEDYVMFPDEATTSLCTWHSRSASRCQLMSLGHNGAVRYRILSEITLGVIAEHIFACQYALLYE
ncbi:Cleavage stimulation factor 50 kDa subunit [Operophtera brumata]|uniref:Cleavage stimulation factor 50 kDa subunit n=1 Tax=Operophtera brumata TaxID=104452 RepID=A0A0L7L8P9_OPEBR|nr:Cleavage stimulation factor 50 kDa subunit [Operophtera brumata]